MSACKTPTARKGTSLLHVISLSPPPSLLLPFFLPFPFAPQFPFSIPPFIAFSFVSKLSPSIPYLSISLFPLTPLSLSFSPLPLTKTVGRLTLITVRFFPPQSDTHTHSHTHMLEKCFASMPGRSKGRPYPSR